ncbi:MAG: GMC family oxidoreductase N-terminal domain-containing protein [Dongiaceae bacterium]
MAAGFDFIVIGAGSAGCVLANRLSAAGASVLLLEAGGGDSRTDIRIPALADQLLDSPVDWGYRTVPQRELLGRKIFLSRGKCLGGTSAINAMVYMRGNRADYDHWRTLGNEGWGYDDVLPCFRRSEGNRHLGGPFHGTDGPLAVSSFPAGSPIHEAFLAAAQDRGLPYNPDVNGATQEGCGPFQATIGLEGRCSAAAAFLHPVADRPNLRVETNAQATSLIVRGSRAVGVEYLKMGRPESAVAGVEIVLCGGAINSPQLLLLSGIGPAADLRRLGIPVLLDLPGVGRNLQDHLQVISRCEVTEPATLFGLTETEAGEAMRQSLEQGTGPFHSNFCEAGAFIGFGSPPGMPDVQIHCESYLSPPYYDGTPADRHGFGLLMNVCRPESRGEVRLHSTDPLDRPLIDPRYLEDARDLDLTRLGLRACLEIAMAAPMREIGTRRMQPDPGRDDDASLTAFIRRAATTIWHPVGTCRMGSDPMAVVDSRLRLHGIDGLRIADASIMPRIVSGNTNAPCIMIGEKASDLVLGAAGSLDREPARARAGA